MELDNQQAKSIYNIGWIVGFLEGEGCIAITKSGVRTRVNGEKYFKFQPLVQITNTDEQTINEGIRILKELDLPFFVSQNRHRDRIAIRINIGGLSRVKKFLELVLPFLTGKKKQAELCLEFINSRLELMKLHPSFKPYSDREREIYNQIKELKIIRLRDYTQETLNRCLRYSPNNQETELI